MSRNLRINGTSFASRVRRRRLDLGLTLEQLGTRAGVTHRTILEIEQGRRDRVQERTALVLARALGFSLDELLAPPGAEPPNEGSGPGRVRNERQGGARRRALLIGALGALVALVGLVVWIVRERAFEGAAHEMRGSCITVRAGVLGALWSADHDTDVAVVARAPWPGRGRIVYGLHGRGTSGGRVYCRDLRTGRVLWTHEPVIEEIAEIYRPEHVEDGGFTVRDLWFADLDGDGRRELVTYHRHHKWFPGFLSAFDAGGRRLGAYYTWGFVYDLVHEDIDDDGREELIVAGTNNAKVYQGATVFILDDAHFGGASVDRYALPGATIGDSSLVRVVLPNFPAPFDSLVGIRRLAAFELNVSKTTDARRVYTALIGEGPGAERSGMLVVTFDHVLRPTACSPTDNLTVKMNAWPAEDRNAFDAAYLLGWLDGHARFGALRRGERAE